MALTYTTIQHSFRKANELTLNEYALCDMVYLLSTNPDSKIKGWCYMSKSKMAEELGLGKRTVEMIINRMIESNFIEKDQETAYLKTSSKWNKVYFSGCAETAHSAQKLRSDSAETAHSDSAETAHYNNKIDNNKIKSGDEAPIYKSLIGKSFELFSEAGISGVYFLKMKNLYGISDVEVNRLFQAWKKEHEATGTIFKTPEHLKNSFNKFIKNSRRGGKQEPEAVPQRVKGGTLIG